MNEFLAQNMNELVTVVTQLLKNGTQLANEQLPELLKQIIQYRMIDIKITYMLLGIVMIPIFIWIIIAVLRSDDFEEFLVYSIIPTLALIIVGVLFAINYMSHQQCIHTPIVVILETIKRM